MRSYPLFGLVCLLTSAALLMGCTTKFKDPEDGETDSIPDSLTDSPVEGTDPLADGQDLPGDGDEEEDGAPVRQVVFTPLSPRTNSLTREIPFVCGEGDGHISNLRALASDGTLYVATTYTVDPTTAQRDCANMTAYSLPGLTQSDDQEICGDAETNIYTDGWLTPSIFEDDTHLFVFEVVDDQSEGIPGQGNVRGYRFRKDGLNDDGTGFVFSGDRPRFTDLLATRCGVKFHFVMRGEEDSPGSPSDYYGFTLDNDSSNEFDRIFEMDQTRDFAEAGHFIDSTLPTPETAPAIYLTSSACRSYGALILGGQEFKIDESVEAMIINFDSELIRSGNSDWSEIFVCSSETCAPENEPATEGLTMVHVERPMGMDRLFAAWISNEASFFDPDPPPSRVHEGSTALSGSMTPDFTSGPLVSPEDAGITFYNYPPIFECSAFKPNHYKLLYDTTRQIVFITGIFYDRRPDEGASEALAGIWTVDPEGRALAEPIFIGTGLPLMLGFETVLDEGSSALYLVWFDYNSSDVDLDAFTVDTVFRQVVIAPVTYFLIE